VKLTVCRPAHANMAAERNGRLASDGYATLSFLMLHTSDLREVMVVTKTPAAVASGQRRIGEHLATWRKLRQLTAAQVADRAGISRHTVMRLENGEGVSTENLLRVARSLGVLDTLVAALDPYATDLGRLRSQEALPERVRPSRPGRTQ
jgi:DNA-binding XRE family transcriptional regulator